MKRTLARRLRTRPISTMALAALALGLGILVGWQAALWGGWLEFELRAQALSLSRSQPASSQLQLHYTYRGRTWFLRVPVSSGALSASRDMPTERVFASRGPLRAAYLRTVVSAASRDPAVDALAEQFRVTRDALRLDDDEYVELMSRFVQQIPYGTPVERFAFPAALLADGEGVCSGKSVLLAALLSHEGYDAAVIALDSNHHAAAAVRGRGPGYLRSGYAYIETTVDAYIGEVPPECGGAGPIEARTQITSVGSRTGRVFRSDIESEFVGETLVRARQAARRLEPYRAYARAASDEDRPVYAGLAERHEEAVRLAASLRLSTDNRPRAFELMTRSAGR